MSRINPVDRETTNDRLRKTFDAIQKQLGVVPNMMRTMAHSPAVLDAYLAFGAALHRGLLPASLQEQIALTVAEVNACDYCLSAHSALGRGAGLSGDEIVSESGRLQCGTQCSDYGFLLADAQARVKRQCQGRSGQSVGFRKIAQLMTA